MPRREEILSNMRMFLQSQDAQWDISPGTPEFKILEAVAQQLENVSFDGLLSTYHFDLDKKAGAELDLFLSLFGFYRQRAKRSTGVVILRRGTDAPNDIAIPLGTQVFVPASNGNPSVYFSTTASAIIDMGQRQVAVPIEANVGGTAGNVSAYTITSFGSTANNVTEAYNPAPTTGGTDAESDDAFRERFKRTFMRSVAGTENQFAGVAFAEPNVKKVSVISPVENYREQIQLYPIKDLSSVTPFEITDLNDTAQLGNFPDIADGENFLVASFNAGAFQDLHRFTVSGGSYTITNSLGTYDKLLVAYESGVRDSKYVFPAGSEIVGTNIGTAYEVLAKPNALDAHLDVADYAMITEAPTGSTPTDVAYPVFVFSSTGAVRLGGPETVVTVQFEYTPIASRNEPPAVMNKMDLFIDGKEPAVISEQVYMVQNDNATFSEAGTLLPSDFVREDGVTQPKVKNIFTMLNRSPVLNLPASITVSRFIAADPDDRDNPKFNLDEAQTYVKDEDYWFVNKKTEAGSYNVYTGTRRSIEGIEWNTPILGSLVQVGANDTYVKPITSQSDDSAPFDLYQSTYVGKLNGYYAYVFTWEADGKESIASEPVALNAKVGNKQVLFHFGGTESTLKTNNVYNDIDFDNTSNAVYRKIYRTKAAASVSDALLGPFYLVKVIKNDDANVYWMDNTADDDLGFTTPPKVPPPHGAPVNIGYTYNTLIERLDNRMDSVRLVGQDIMTHQATEVPVKFNLAVVPNYNTSYNSIKTAVSNALRRFLDAKPFGSDIQKADLIAAVETAPEVDNVRLLEEEEMSNETFEIQITSPAQLATTDTMVINVDGYSTPSLTANEQGYIVRESLESLSIFDAGDTYATFLTSSLLLKGQDTALEDETTLTVWDNTNADRIATLFESGYGDLYLQITQLGEDNLHKDEIVKVTAVGTDFPAAFKTYDILGVTRSGNNVTLTTAIHGLDVGNTISVYDNSDTVIDDFTLTAVTANTVTFVDAGATVPSNLTSYFTFELSEGSRTFTVARGQLGSVKRSYGNGTDDVSNDVLRAGSEAWVHILGDVAVAKDENANGTEVTYTVSMLDNIFTQINNWAHRSLYDVDNNYRISVEPSGNISSKIVRKTAGLGSGIEVVSSNLRTIQTEKRYFDDIYFDSHELLVFGGLDLVLKARNTFNRN